MHGGLDFKNLGIEFNLANAFGFLVVNWGFHILSLI
jgi:hypothetical protein